MSITTVTSTRPDTARKAMLMACNRAATAGSASSVVSLGRRIPLHGGVQGTPASGHLREKIRIDSRLNGMNSMKL